MLEKFAAYTRYLTYEQLVLIERSDVKSYAEAIKNVAKRKGLSPSTLKKNLARFKRKKPKPYTAEETAVFAESIEQQSETEKFASILSSAPAWLRYFCLASLDGRVLRFPLPTQSEVPPECGRDGLRDMKSWPDLPSGTIGAGRPIPKTRAFDALSTQELIAVIGLLKSSEDSWSHRDRRRHKEILSKIDNDELSRAYLMLAPDLVSAASP
jgi:hypothetical protein